MDGEISPAAVHELLEGDDETTDALRIVDIRNAMEFERGHIPGSENVPFHELTARIDEFEAADRIITVCPHGKASVQAARLIGSYEGSADARVESMAGGLEEWADSYELVSGSTENDSAARDASETPF
ncbi:rhodanese-like domain-containing protein [Halobacteria archaeon AArc-curdl1]|uniref:Rhodanese-like domain-containing protein n=1 Tax=Natronosalvus hydrolyticus TaxID=2979988 RepID=A0AAP2Z6M2_9EURY|nr:rhodanese-like domain-containing protein [Halobacteria archaeon AArc-curdl1]